MLFHLVQLAKSIAYDHATFEHLGEGYLASEVATLRITTTMMPSLPEAINVRNNLHQTNDFLKKTDYHSLKLALEKGFTTDLCDKLWMSSLTNLNSSIIRAEWMVDNLQPQRQHHSRQDRGVLEWLMSLLGLWNRHGIDHLQADQAATAQRQNKVVHTIAHQASFDKDFVKEVESHMEKLEQHQYCQRVSHVVDELTTKLATQTTTVKQILRHQMPIDILFDITPELVQYEHHLMKHDWRLAAPIFQLLAQMPISFMFTKTNVIMVSELPIRPTKGWTSFAFHKLTDNTIKLNDTFVKADIIKPIIAVQHESLTMTEMSQEEIDNCQKIPMEGGKAKFFCRTNTAQRFPSWQKVDICLFHLLMRSVQGVQNNCKFTPVGKRHFTTSPDKKALFIDTMVPETKILTFYGAEQNVSHIQKGHHTISCPWFCTIQVDSNIFALHPVVDQRKLVVKQQHDQPFAYLRHLRAQLLVDLNNTLPATHRRLEQIERDISIIRQPPQPSFWTANRSIIIATAISLTIALCLIAGLAIFWHKGGEMKDIRGFVSWFRAAQNGTGGTGPTILTNTIEKLETTIQILQAKITDLENKTKDYNARIIDMEVQMGLKR